MKRLAPAFFLLLPGCFSSQEAQKPLVWGADRDGGIPYVFADPNDPDKTIGFEADLADALAKELDRKIVFQQRAFDSLLADVQRGDVDLAMNGLEILPDRLNLVAFSKPYYRYRLQLAVKADSPHRTLDDLLKANLNVGTLESTAAERELRDRGFDPKTYPDQEGPYKDLSLGREIGGVLLDVPAALYYASGDRSPKYGRNIPGVKMVGEPFAQGHYGIAVAKSNLALKVALDKAIDRLRANGELKRIYQKWHIWSADQEADDDDVAVATGERMRFAQYFPLLLHGALFTVYITFAGMAVAVLLGLPIALARLYGPAPVRWLAVGYVEFFRGIPVLLLIYFLYYGLADLVPGLKLGALTAAILGFGLNYAAYEAEIYRAGLGSIPAGQWEAAASLGMWPTLAFRRIVLPQAVRVILPPMTNDFVALFKDTSVVSVIAVTELSKQYQILTKSGGGYLEIGLVTAALYLAMSVPLGYVSRHLEQRWGGK